MIIKRFVSGLLESNGYVIYQKEKEDCYVIDPGGRPADFAGFIKKNGLKLKGILLTHHHSDHVGGVKRLRAMCPCPVYIHRLDADACRKKIDIYMEDGDIIRLGEEEIKVLHTPGHTKGGVCFYSEKSKLVFTGDTIFAADIGRIDLNGGSEKEMRETMRSVVNGWGNDITIYPGHGESLSMKEVRKLNREFLDMIVGEE